MGAVQNYLQRYIYYSVAVPIPKLLTESDKGTKPPPD